MIDREYPEYRKHLGNLISELRKELPGPLEGFSTLHQNAVADGALSNKHKELIAIAIAISTGCEGCIAFHVHDALKAGATREELIETIGVAVLMGGGRALMYSSEALEALDQFKTASAHLTSV